jgi:hypothetical protein
MSSTSKDLSKFKISRILSIGIYDKDTNYTYAFFELNNEGELELKYKNLEERKS